MGGARLRQPVSPRAMAHRHPPELFRSPPDCAEVGLGPADMVWNRYVTQSEATLERRVNVRTASTIPRGQARFLATSAILRK